MATRGMTKHTTTSIGAISSAAYLCCLYASSLYTPTQSSWGLPIRLPEYIGLQYLATPLAVCFVADFLFNRAWRVQRAGWAWLTLLCELSGIIGFLLTACAQKLDELWPSPIIDEPFSQGSPWISAWYLGGLALVGVGYVGAFIYRVTAKKVINADR